MECAENIESRRQRVRETKIHEAKITESNDDDEKEIHSFKFSV